ncbi:MAG: alpha/beta hydrolase [Desulfobacteraceae bacterium]|nr:alpha/beta hydrolase [Desulfobacteraceae bacterium]
MKCTIKDIELNYKIIGKGHPILIIHGIEVDHRYMSESMEPVFHKTNNWKRIYIDLPGMGQTKAKDWICSPDHILEIIIGFIDKVIPNQHFAVADLSFGGYLARGICYHLFDRLTGLCLIVPSIHYNERSLPEMVAFEKDVDFFSDIPKKEKEGFEMLHAVQTKEKWEIYQKRILPGVQMADQTLLERVAGKPFTFSVDKLPQPFDKPTLILLGRYDVATGYKDAWDIYDNFPRGTFVVLDKAGHNLPIDQEALFNNLFSDWLDRTETAINIITIVQNN